MRSSILLLALLPSLPCSAQTSLKSAREILDLPALHKSSIVTASKPVPSSAIGEWESAARELQRTSATNTPAQNAKAWLALSAQRAALPALTNEGGARPSLSQLVKALPSPASWPEILKQARADYLQAPTETNATNLYLAARLQNDSATQVEALRGLYRILLPQFQESVQKYPIAKSGMGRPNYDEQQKATVAMQRFSSFANLLLESPSAAQKLIGVNWLLETTPRSDSYSYFNVPDLVKQLGEAAAKPVLLRILRSPLRTLWYNAGQTTGLAARLWLSDAQAQRRVQWELADSAQNGALALTMTRRFPKLSGDDAYNASGARQQALDTLLAQGQVAQANQLLKLWMATTKSTEVSNETYSYYQPVSFHSITEKEAPELQLKKLRWVESALKMYPQLAWWNSYRYVSLRLDDTPSRLKLLQTVVAQSNFSKLTVSQRAMILGALSAAYLDSNQVQRGGDTLVSALKTRQNAKDNEGGLQDDVASLLRLTRVVPNASWMQAAQQAARFMSAHQNDSDGGSDAEGYTRLALNFAEQKQNVFAQSLLADAYRATIKLQAKNSFYYGDAAHTRAYLFGLMAIYKNANRPADMVYLLQHAQGWGEKELTPLLTYNTMSSGDDLPDDPELKTLPRLGYLAAWALAKTNHSAQASQVVRALIEREGGYDAAYRLLCDLEGQSADAFLRQQAARDPFEERPLIWRAFLARRAGKFAQAQQLAQSAIAIDPSDGDEGRGDRLRAYSELGGALRGQGQNAAAQKVEGAVHAIRLAEDADYLRIAGLTTRAIALYKTSLGFFDDAYCVQSRLAVQLVSLGRYQEAAQHFRRAYELMPQSFGRLESHCFGCEGVFGGTQENGIARQVFLQLEKAQPNNPKVAYLSGYWRSVSGQKRDASRYFLRAVTLDPLYLSAWKQLSYTGEFLTPAQNDRTTLKILELDPRGVHEGGGVSFAVNNDWRGLWETTRRILPRKNPQLQANYPLPASQQNTFGQSWAVWDLVSSPSAAIAGQNFVTQLSALNA